jgi:tetratricopeptide (TPR) repeat protein
VDARDTWHELQSHLSAARACLDTGNHEQALAEADAALAIDPQFLAAQSLRERILAAAPFRPFAPSRAVSRIGMPAGLAAPDPPVEFAAADRLVEPVVADPPDEPVAADPLVDLPLRAPAIQPASTAEIGYAKFELRAKRRRVDRRLDAARAAIAHGRVHEASGALDEVRHLDPNATELRELTTALENLRRAGVAPRRGAWLAAVLAFGFTVFAASWLEENQHALLSHPMLIMSGLVATPHQDTLARMADDSTPPAEREDDAALASAPVGTSGPAELATPSPEPATAAPAVNSVPVTAAPAVQMPTISMPPPSIPLAPAPLHAALPAAAPPSAPAPASTASSTAIAAAASSPPADASPIVMASERPQVDEAALVRQALQRYRVAYDGLDAGSAQAVWPAVNQGALAKAFDGLESQTLTFDECRVQLQNETATAMCRGTTRYVPKVGSREPRTEPRVWNFSLRKNGAEWKIDNARVER